MLRSLYREDRVLSLTSCKTPMCEILLYFHVHQKPTAMLCHGPIAAIAALPFAHEFRAALIAAIKRRQPDLPKVGNTRATRREVGRERHPPRRDVLPRGRRLQIAGAEVITTPVDFEPHVIEDRELITGQNPRSDKLISEKLPRSCGVCPFIDRPRSQAYQ
jgi:putative intracellular protease/amidase